MGTPCYLYTISKKTLPSYVHVHVHNVCSFQGALTIQYSCWTGDTFTLCSYVLCTILEKKRHLQYLNLFSRSSDISSTVISITLTRVSALGKDPSQEATIVEKILNLDESSSSVKEMWLKWRENRGVTGLRPPPGGPMAPTNVMSTSLRKAPVGT